MKTLSVNLLMKEVGKVKNGRRNVNVELTG